MTTHERFGDPPMVMSRGRVYWSAGIIAVIAGGIASFAITRSQVDGIVRKQEHVDTVMEGVATKEDVKELGRRIDEMYNILITQARKP